VRPIASVPYHTHLMVAQPLRHARAFADAGSDLIVAHDTEMPEVNGYEPLLSSFAHRADFKLVTPWTTLVSDVAPVW